MSLALTESLASLYETDETSWLERMAELIAERRFSDLDYDNLREFLTDMARRDKREVLSRLTVLIAHRLKWEHQPTKRTTSWESTIAEQRRELEVLLESGTLFRHARDVLGRAYEGAVEQAAIETGRPASSFPAESERSLEDWLARGDFEGEGARAGDEKES